MAATHLDARQTPAEFPRLGRLDSVEYESASTLKARHATGVGRRPNEVDDAEVVARDRTRTLERAIILVEEAGAKVAESVILEESALYRWKSSKRSQTLHPGSTGRLVLTDDGEDSLLAAGHRAALPLQVITASQKPETGHTKPLHSLRAPTAIPHPPRPVQLIPHGKQPNAHMSMSRDG